ncbi:MAG: TadE/TadG family type IV pilus assembly protein [Geminicoccaceae bacterium]
MSNELPIGANRRIWRSSPKRRLDERGVGAIEFALMLPVVLTLIVGIIEMSNVYFMRNQLNEIARDATRRFAVGALDESEVKAFVLKRVAQTTRAKANVDVTETETDDIVDVSLSLSVPFADVLLFDHLIKSLWSGAPDALSVNATMMKH